jgi:4-amino-4-deoxy-L-arabinose transferase-like glycosyltransferase
MTSPASTSNSPRALYVVFALMLVATLWFTTRAWHATILDRHEFRQLQTAVSAYWIKEAGYKLDYETPLFGPPWSVPMEFPVYQWIVARTSQALGTGLEVTARGVSLFFFFATLPAVAGFAALLGLDRPRRLLVVSAVLASPTYLFYARTFMIETTALCGAAWFCLGVARAVRDGSVRWALIAALAGTGAALAKVTTFLIFCPPAAVLTLWAWRRNPPGGNRVRPLLLAGAPVALAIVIGWLWVKHSDVVKHSNPYTGFLTSSELAKWNWGTLEQRLSARFWGEFWSNVSGFVLGEAALVVLLVALALAAPPLRRAALWCGASFLGGVLLFSNLFFFHDYYYCANALLLLTGAGLLLVAVWDDARLPRAARLTLIGGFLAGQLLVYYRGYGDYARRELPQPPGVAEIIRATVPADGVVLIHGWDWNSLVPYYAQRRAIMVPNGREDELNVLEDVLRRLGNRRVAALLVRTEQLRQSPTFVRWRTERFHLASAPVATSEAGDLYLAEDLVSGAVAALKDKKYDGVELHLADQGARPDEKLDAVAAAALDLPIFTPRPSGGRTRFGMSAGSFDGQPVLNAHAPSELRFVAPAGAHAIHAEFGLPDASFSGGTTVTDGIGVEILERQPNGLTRVLFHRELDPAHTSADRGRQRIDLNDTGPIHGELIFRFTPGLRDNVVNDWAYWGTITIR